MPTPEETVTRFRDAIRAAKAGDERAIRNCRNVVREVADSDAPESTAYVIAVCRFLYNLRLREPGVTDEEREKFKLD